MSVKMNVNSYFYTGDHLGSTSMVLDADGNISQSVTYIPYGEIFVEERNGTWNTPYLFNGKELDEETGLYYYGARYLNPTNGMWLSTDPLFEKYMGMSPYNYCAGNPVKIIDPTGMEGYEVNNETGEYWWNPDVTAENVAEGFTYIPTEEMLDEVVVIAQQKEVNQEEFVAQKKSDFPIDNFQINVGGSLVAVGGFTGQISLGYFKKEGFYINASAGEGLGLDVGFFLTAELGRYKGKKGDGINSLTGFSNYVSGGADCVTIEYNQSFDKRYSSVEFGLSIGTKSLPMVSGSAGFTNTWNLFRTDVFNEKK
jgi:RHS repeat-associated protein